MIINGIEYITGNVAFGKWGDKGRDMRHLFPEPDAYGRDDHGVWVTVIDPSTASNSVRLYRVEKLDAHRLNFAENVRKDDERLRMWEREQEAIRQAQAVLDDQTKVRIGAPKSLPLPVWCEKYDGWYYPAVLLPPQLVRSLPTEAFRVPYPKPYGFAGRYWNLEVVRETLLAHPQGS
jgi:hypothetical protein